MMLLWETNLPSDHIAASNMVPSSSKDLILVLHSSCGDNDDEEEEAVRLSSKMVEADDNDIILSSLPISCDILILPEIPHHSRINVTSPDHHPQVMELLQNQFNPCGMSNVLLLENLPWRNVLLSLTSCSVAHETLLLPVEPFPSTFDFSFQGTLKSMVQLTVEFDFASAKNQLEDKQQMAEPSLLGASKGEHTIRVNEPLPAPISTYQHVPRLLANEGTLIQEEDVRAGGSECPQAPDPHVFNSFYTDMCITPWQERSHHRSQENSHALTQLQAMMEKEAKYLDRILMVVAVVGLVLFVLLCWSGYQLYRCSTKEDERIQEVRAALRRKIFASGMEFNPTSLEPLSLDAILKKVESPPRNVNTGNDKDCLVVSPKPKEPSPARELESPQESVKTSSTKIRKVTPSAERSDHSDHRPLPAPVIPQREPPFWFLPPQPRGSLSHPINQKGAIPTPPVRPQNPACNDSEKVELSSTSKLAQAKVTVSAPPVRPQNPKTKIDFVKAELSSRFKLCQQTGGTASCPVRHQSPANNGSDETQLPPRSKLAEQKGAIPTPPTSPQNHARNGSHKVKLSPCSTLTERKGAIPAPPTSPQNHARNIVDKVELSPCSKLAQQWAQRKTVRQTNRRKKRQPKLQPFSIKSAMQDQPIMTKHHLVPSSGTSVPILGPPPLVSTAKGNDFESQLSASPKVLRESPLKPSAKSDPSPSNRFNLDMPKLHKHRLQEASRVESHQKGHHRLIHSSESPVYAPVLPELCSTPGSEDDSFVDDYWQMG